ncbi:hypothetical protein JTB14_001973 [Gonioctena quinquepunctata]|nr:hypothetical protein JTB14_001973 [Gonioctena quinquepunctata]
MEDGDSVTRSCLDKTVDETKTLILAAVQAAVQEGIDNISRDFRRTFDDEIPDVRYTLSRKYDILAERMTVSEQKVLDHRSKNRPVLAVPPFWEPTHEIEI